MSRVFKWRGIAFVLISTLPFWWVFGVKHQSFGFVPTMANVFGLVGSTLLLWQFALGNRFISTKVSPDYVALTRLHIFLGTYGIIFAFTHPFLQMVAYGESLAFVFVPKLGTPFYQGVAYGRTAFYLLIFVWLTSAIFRKRIPFRIWLYMHYLTYPILFLVFFHAKAVGIFVNSVPLVSYYWGGLYTVFWVLVAFRILKYLNFGKARYRLKAKKTLPADVTQYVFEPLRQAQGHGLLGRRLTPKPGQFAFVRPRMFGESHPFTIMKFNEKTGAVTFSIKAVGRFTNHLEKIKVGQIAYLDGPYGVFTREGQNSDPKVVIAGGIGVTPFVELIDRFGSNNTFMFYANSNLADAVNREDFKAQLKENYVDVVSQEKVVHEPVVQGRMSKEILQKYLGEKFLPDAKFFVCGSAGFMASVKGMLSELGVPKEKVFMEEFSL